MFLYKQHSSECATYIYYGRFLDVMPARKGFVVRESCPGEFGTREWAHAPSADQALERAATLLDLEIRRNVIRVFGPTIPPTRVQVRDAFEASKGSSACEGGLFISTSCYAIVDGAPAKAPHLIQGDTPGVFAKNTLIESLAKVRAKATSAELLAVLTKDLAAATKLAYGVAPEFLAPYLRPAASAVIFRPIQRELIFVGDTQALIDNKHFQFLPALDQVAAEVRSRVIRALGPTYLNVQQLATDAIAPLLDLGTTLRNRAGAAGFSTFDGTPMDPKTVRILSVPQGTAELVLANKGYKELYGTLTQTEAVLAQSLEQDPLCTKRLKDVTGVMPGCTSYDDRVYLRLALS